MLCDWFVRALELDFLTTLALNFTFTPEGRPREVFTLEVRPRSPRRV